MKSPAGWPEASRCALLATAILFVLSGVLNAGDVELFQFDDKETLENGFASLSLSPSAGRIVEFKRKGGENVLRISSKTAFEAESAATGYRNYGGDKVWNSQQYDWIYSLHRINWPPDESTDGQPWSLTEISAGKATIRSEVSKHMGTRLTRTVELLPGSAKARITNVLEQVEPSVFPSIAWTVSQVRPPKFSLLDSRRPCSGGGAWTDLRATGSKGSAAESRPGIVKFQPVDLTPKPKVGTLGRWLAAVYENEVFMQRCELDPRGCYPDGASLEIFATEGNYEIETLSPQVHLQPGERIVHVTFWELLDRASGKEAELTNQILERTKE